MQPTTADVADLASSQEMQQRGSLASLSQVGSVDRSKGSAAEGWLQDVEVRLRQIHQKAATDKRRARPSESASAKFVRKGHRTGRQVQTEQICLFPVGSQVERRPGPQG